MAAGIWIISSILRSLMAGTLTVTGIGYGRGKDNSPECIGKDEYRTSHALQVGDWLQARRS
jgi:hypothetical protein